MASLPAYVSNLKVETRHLMEAITQQGSDATKPQHILRIHPVEKTKAILAKASINWEGPEFHVNLSHTVVRLNKQIDQILENPVDTSMLGTDESIQLTSWMADVMMLIQQVIRRKVIPIQPQAVSRVTKAIGVARAGACATKVAKNANAIKIPKKMWDRPVLFSGVAYPANITQKEKDAI